jgi:hypothetical protein
VKSGRHKGNIGIVKDCTDVDARVELHSMARTVTIPLVQLKVISYVSPAPLSRPRGHSSQLSNTSPSTPCRSSTRQYIQSAVNPEMGGMQTPHYSGQTPMHGGATPMHGGQTPMYGGATPFDGSRTPLHGGATPGGMWDPQQTPGGTDYAEPPYEGTPKAAQTPATPGGDFPYANSYTPAADAYTPAGDSYTPGMDYAPTTDTPGYVYSTTPGVFTPATPGDMGYQQPMSVAAPVELTWHRPGVHVTTLESGQGVTQGVIARVAADGTCRVVVQPTGHEYDIPSAQLQPVPPSEKGHKVGV